MCDVIEPVVVTSSDYTTNVVIAIDSAAAAAAALPNTKRRTLNDETSLHQQGKRSDAECAIVNSLKATSNHQLLTKINSGHVLYSILPRETVSAYAFRRRRHNRELISKTTHLAQCSFIVRMLYKDMY